MATLPSNSHSLSFPLSHPHPHPHPPSTVTATPALRFTCRPRRGHVVYNFVLRCKVGNILWHKHATCNNVAQHSALQRLIADFAGRQAVYECVCVCLYVRLCVCVLRLKLARKSAQSARIQYALALTTIIAIFTHSYTLIYSYTHILTHAHTPAYVALLCSN